MTSATAKKPDMPGVTATLLLTIGYLVTRSNRLTPDASDSVPMVSILSGLIGGLLATIVMTVFMMALGDDSPPPTAALWAKYVGDEGPESYMMQGMALHMMYGIVAGGAFAVGVTALGLGVATLTSGLLWAVVYGLLLTVVGAVFWMRVVLAMEPEPAMVGMFALFHVIYGVVLGAAVVYLPL